MLLLLHSRTGLSIFNDKMMKAKMWLIVLNKLFCMHGWTSHAKTHTNHVGHKEWIDDPKFYVKTTEVLICDRCGKVKTIKY